MNIHSLKISAITEDDQNQKLPDNSKSKKPLRSLFMDRAQVPQDCRATKLQNVNMRPKNVGNDFHSNQDQYINYEKAACLDRILCHNFKHTKYYFRHAVFFEVEGPPLHLCTKCTTSSSQRHQDSQTTQPSQT